MGKNKKWICYAYNPFSNYSTCAIIKLLKLLGITMRFALKNIVSQYKILKVINGISCTIENLIKVLIKSDKFYLQQWVPFITVIIWLKKTPTYQRIWPNAGVFMKRINVNCNYNICKIKNHSDQNIVSGWNKINQTGWEKFCIQFYPAREIWHLHFSEKMFIGTVKQTAHIFINLWICSMDFSCVMINK